MEDRELIYYVLGALGTVVVVGIGINRQLADTRARVKALEDAVESQDAQWTKVLDKLNRH